MEAAARFSKTCRQSGSHGKLICRFCCNRQVLEQQSSEGRSGDFDGTFWLCHAQHGQLGVNVVLYPLPIRLLCCKYGIDCFGDRLMVNPNKCDKVAMLVRVTLPQWDPPSFFSAYWIWQFNLFGYAHEPHLVGMLSSSLLGQELSS